MFRFVLRFKVRGQKGSSRVAGRTDEVAKAVAKFGGSVVMNAQNDMGNTVTQEL